MSEAAAAAFGCRVARGLERPSDIDLPSAPSTLSAAVPALS